MNWDETRDFLSPCFPECIRDELAMLLRRYDRTALYEQVWSRAAHEVAKSYGVSVSRF